jgi:hypothetical protein
LTAPADHKHVFGETKERNNKPGFFYQICNDCSKEVEFEEF